MATMKKKRFFLIVSVLLFFGASKSDRPTPASAWNPDAGYIPPFTSNARVSASSNAGAAAKVLDGDLQTAWQSEAPLPQAFIGRQDQNIFLNKAPSPAGCTSCSQIGRLTDGDLATAAFIKAGDSGWATVSFEPGADHALFSISIKCQVREPLLLQFVDLQGVVQPIGTYGLADNFQLKRWEIPGGRAKSVELAAPADFEVFEIAALAGLPKESVVIDWGSTKPVGTIHTRHWAGEQAAVKTVLWLSDDGKDWRLAAELDPEVLHTFISDVSPEIAARYLKVEHTLPARDWNKVFLWEVRVYDRFGPYGSRPPAHMGYTTLRELLGVNGYWSWGTNQYAEQLKPDGGPWRYRPVASHARNYHDLTWDIPRPGVPIDFKDMAQGKGTPANGWLNWDREYGAWAEAGFNIQASLQFFRYDPARWKNPEKEAYDYAFAFTRHFGLKKGNGLICSIEAGNEPWSYPAEVYRKILLGMARGAAIGDDSVEVLPCALQAADPSVEKSGIFKNYIGARIPPEAAPLLDGINIHAYSYAADSRGKRRGVHPEHAHSTFWEILNAIRWRNENMPGKKIYLSEWGWESPGGGEDCIHDECVSEQAAASYAVRGALISARLGLDRATWFYYANESQPSSLYTRSGLTGSARVNFGKKRCFLALQSLVERAGSSYFHSIVREDERAWMYLLGNAAGQPTHLVAWLPVDGNSDARRTLHWKTKATVRSAVVLDGASASGTAVPAPVRKNGEIVLELGTIPLLLELEADL